MMTSSKDPMHALLHSVTPTLQQATNNSDLLWKLLVLTGKSGSVSCGITAPFSWVLAHTRFCLYPRRVHFPTLCKLWQLYDGVNGNLLQEGLYHTHVCCTQSSSPCGRPLLTGTSSRDTQTQFCLSVCGIPGSWCVDFFALSEHLCQEWGLILNANSPLLPSCLGFSFVLGSEFSPHGHSSAYRLTGVSLTLDVGFLFTAAPVLCSHCSDFRP